MTSENQIQYIVEQLGSAGMIRAKKMFGDYGLYLNEKFFALVCDDKLFFKVKGWPEHEILERFGNMNPAYPGAKNTAQVDGEMIENKEKLATLAREVVEKIV